MSLPSLNKSMPSLNSSTGTGTTTAAQHAKFLADFAVLTKKSIDDQLELFLKSFIFALGENWKEAVTLSTVFRMSDRLRRCRSGQWRFLKAM